MRKYHLFLILFIIVTLTGCAAPRISKFQDPFFNGASNRRSNDIDAKLIDFLNESEISISAHFYQCSHQEIMDAFIEAVNRGVKVRFITDYHYYVKNYDIFYKQLETAGIKVIHESENRDKQMESHNKYAIVDEKAVWTGSYNITENGTIKNNNNAFIIRSKEVAQAYLQEFNEQWGSEGLEPDLEKAKFGKDKIDNTPHIFTLFRDDDIEVYFAPSDNVINEIVSELDDAQYSIYFATNNLSHDDIERIIEQKHQEGVKVSGVIDSKFIRFTDIIDIVNTRIKRHTDVTPHGKTLHHKIIVIDGNKSDSNPTVITGSANYSKKVEEYNDENVVIIHDPKIAKEYIQEINRMYGGGIY